jgi:hypothetical protein
MAFAAGKSLSKLAVDPSTLLPRSTASAPRTVVLDRFIAASLDATDQQE